MKRLPAAALAAVSIASASSPLAQTSAEPPLSPKLLRAALQTKPDAAAALRLAERLRGWFGKESLERATSVKLDGPEAAWAVDASDAKAARVVADGGSFILNLSRLDGTPLFAGVETLPDGAAMRWSFEVDGKRLGGGQLEAYAVHADNVEQAGAPKGKVVKQPNWKSRIFEGTDREWWVYVPAQYKPASPAAVMVFQDGASRAEYVPTVFDNLIARGEMPVTVGVFINPGVFADGRRNRSFEYDTLSDQYARFLLEEILPEVEKTTKLRHDAASRAISGASSGGICAFTAAWQRPDQFSKVLSWIGSFTNIASGPSLREGGHNYPALIRKTPPKPIRVFLQEGENDLDNVHGNWPLANKQLAQSLAFARYDYKLAMGQGFHSDRHGRAILPDSLRWLWRDYKPEAAAATASAAAR